MTLQDPSGPQRIVDFKIAEQPEYMAGEVANRRRLAGGSLSRLELAGVGAVALAAASLVVSVVWRLLS